MKKRGNSCKNHIVSHALSFLLGICLLCTQLLTVNATTNPTDTGKSDANGSGGGGGVVGGNAGESVLHYHDSSCEGSAELPRTAVNKYRDYRDDDDDLIHSYETIAEGDTNGAGYISLNCAFQLNSDSRGGSHAYLKAYDQNGNIFWTKTPDALVEEGRTLWNNATPGNAAAINVWDQQPYNADGNVDYTSSGEGYIVDTDYYWIHRDMNGKLWRYVVYHESNDYVPTPSANMRGMVSNSERHGTSFWNSTNYSIKTTIAIPSYVTYVKFVLRIEKNHRVDFGTNADVYNATLGGFYGCGYNNGDIVRHKASLGGTSDISTTGAINGTNINTTQTTQSGDGIFQLQIVNGNLLNGLNNLSYLNNIPIRDLAIPDSVKNLNISNYVSNRVVRWEKPESNGTEYEFKAQTYAIDYNSPSGTTLIMDTELN